MNILIGNNTLSFLGGSETWVQTLAIQLKEMGHQVFGFSPELGVIAENLKKHDIVCYNDLFTSGVKPFSFVLEEKQELQFDIIIANHNHIVDYLRSQFPDTPIISTIHGIIHKTKNEADQIVLAPEHPALDAKVSQFVAVSEEIQETLKRDYNIDSMIIRNFFDTKQYQAKRPATPGKPKTFLVNSNYFVGNDPVIEIIREVSKHYKARLIAVGMNFGASNDVMKAIEDADIVVGMGRSVMEGVCAGRLGIVHGRWGTGGIINEHNINDLRQFNFSGRNSGGILFTVEQMIAEIDKNYNPATIEWGRNYVLREHNVVHAAETFLQTAKSLLNKPAESEVIIKPYRRANT